MSRSTEEMMEKQKSPRINSWCGWDPLEEIWVGRNNDPEYFNTIKNPKVRSPLQKIAEETEEDFQNLISILKQYGVSKIMRPEFDKGIRFGDGTPVHATNPRDHHWVYGDGLYRFEDMTCYDNLYKEYEDENHRVYNPYKNDAVPVTNDLEASQCVRFGDAVLVDRLDHQHMKWFRQNFPDTKVLVSTMGGHSDGVFCPVKPGLIISTYEYKFHFQRSIFKDWQFAFTDNNSWEEMKPLKNSVSRMLNKTNQRWYVEGEENNDEFIHFVDTYLNEWVGYVAESVFDVNMLVLDQNHVVVKSYNKKIFDILKKHQIEPIICNLRHCFFWDNGLHCNTLDIRRNGKKERYLNY